MKTKLFSFVIALVASAGTIMADSVKIGELCYELYDANHTAKVVSQYGFTAHNSSNLINIAIPASVEYNSATYNVTGIGKWAFCGCDKLVSVTIPNSVTSLDYEAFMWCSALTSIEIPNSVTSIGKRVFVYCYNLAQVVIPNSIESIGDQAFAVCNSLTDVTIPNSVISIGVEAFSECEKLTAINVAIDNPKYCSVDGVVFNKDRTTIVAYPGGKQGNYTIPNSVTSIADGAFYGSFGLTGVTIPSNVTNIGKWGFGKCFGLTSMTCEALTPPTCGEDVFEFDLSIPLFVPAESIEAYLVADGWKEFTNIQTIQGGQDPCIISSGICGESLTWKLTCDSVLVFEGSGDMNNWSWGEAPWNEWRLKIKHVNCPNTLNSIGSYAFFECDNLQDINIPEGLTTIGGGAFERCWSLSIVNLPCSLSSLGNGAFSYASVQQFNVASGNTHYCSIDGALFNKEQTRLIQYNRGRAKSAYVVPVGVQIVGGGSFIYCLGVQNVTFPASVTTIDDVAFSQCYDLHTVYCHPSTPPTTVWNSFEFVDLSNCTLYVPAASIDLYSSADVWKDFGNIFPLEEESTPCLIASGTCGAEGDNVIWELSCDSLLNIIGNGATEDYTFYTNSPWYPYYSQIKHIIVHEGIERIGSYSFSGCPAETVKLPNSLLTVGRNILEGLHKLRSIVIPENLTNIDYDAFHDADIESVVWLAKHCEFNDWSFYGSAFNNCNHLKYLEIGEDVDYLPRYLTNASPIDTIVCYAVVPPTISATTFTNVNTSSVILLVPEGSIEVYSTTDIWKDFFHIEGIEVDVETIEEEHSIRYLKRNGSLLFKENIMLQVPEAPEIEGFTFKGWDVVAGHLANGIILEAVYEANTPTSTPETVVNPANKSQKLIRNGNVYILTETMTYTIHGQELR